MLQTMTRCSNWISLGDNGPWHRTRGRFEAEDPFATNVEVCLASCQRSQDIMEDQKFLR